MISTKQRKNRCAIYTRVSSEEHLNQEFDSLDAQRLSGEAFVESQKHEGWLALSRHYDDAGFTGGNMERPALRELFDDIRSGKIDCVVVYKVDRLSRAILDFSQIVRLFEEHDVSFVSVTQQFNTTTSMGRLTLNMLMSFAQYERELCGERIRDKKLATAKQGKYIGGGPVLGYDVIDKKYVLNDEEAPLVRRVFELFLAGKSCRQVAITLNGDGLFTKQHTTRTGRVMGGKRWMQRHIYRIVTDRKYVGDIVHKGQSYPGEHEAVVMRKTFERALELLQHNCISDNPHPYKIKRWAMLRSLMRCGHCGNLIKPSFTTNNGRQYRYYTCSKKATMGYRQCPLPNLNAGEIERAVVEQLLNLLRHPDVVARTYRNIREQEDTAAIELNDVIASLQNIGPLWDALFPAERERIVRLLVEEVTVTTDGMEIRFHTNGIEEIVNELQAAEVPE